jgi:hypothetical protein
VTRRCVVWFDYLHVPLDESLADSRLLVACEMHLTEALAAARQFTWYGETFFA